MRASVFDDLLDEHLSAPPSVLREWTTGPARTATAYGFFFGAQPVVALSPASQKQATVIHRFRIEITGSAPRTTIQEDMRSAPVSGRVAPPLAEPPTRLLSRTERAAVAEMHALGASLSPHFTFGELRRAFRRLALRYHPDRHPGGSADERAQLSDRFARARDAYQILSAIFTRRG